jgi:uncharacterized membrane protein YdjX (TVP38/TMEM64 family)
MMHWLETYLHNLGNYGILGGLLFIVSFAALSMLGLPLIPFAATAGLLFGLGGGLLAVVTGSTLGAACGFLCSRHLARRRCEALLQKHPHFRTIDDAVRREGWKIVGLLRLCPLPFGLSNYCYGLTGVPFGQYLVATILGMLPGETVFVYLGATGRQWVDSPSGISSSPLVKILFYAGLVAAVFVLVLLRSIVTKRISPTGNSDT